MMSRKDAGIDAHPEDQRDQRREDRDLAPVQVEDRLQVFLGQLAEDDPAVEIEHVGGAQDHAGRRQQRDPGVDLEGADQDQELADEAAGARQADRGQHEDHEDQGIDRHDVHQAAVARDLAGVQPVVDHADDRNSAAETTPWDSIWKIAPSMPCTVTVKMPMVTKPMCATEE